MHPGVTVMSGNRIPSGMISFDSLGHVCLAQHQAESYAALARHEVLIAVGSATIAVRFSRKSVARVFAERFGDTPGCGKPERVVYAVVADGQAFFWRVADRARRWPEEPNDERCVFFADNFALHDYLSTSDDLGLHAAVVASDNGVAALLGRSTAGKTTTALAMVRNGLCFYSDDRCIIQAGRVVPFLRAITLRDGGRMALLAHTAPSTLYDTLHALPAGQDNPIRPRALFGERAGGPPRPLDALFLIEGRAADAAISDCSFYGAVPAVLGSMVSRDRGIDRAARLLSEMRNIPIYRLQLGTPHATAVLVERTLDERVSGARR